MAGLALVLLSDAKSQDEQGKLLQASTVQLESQQHFENSEIVVLVGLSIPSPLKETVAEQSRIPILAVHKIAMQ